MFLQAGNVTEHVRTFKELSAVSYSFNSIQTIRPEIIFFNNLHPPFTIEENMYLVREILNCKPGRVKELVAMFKESFNHMDGSGLHNPRVMTDTAATYWTLVAEFEVEDPGDVWKGHQMLGQREEYAAAMKGYMDCVQGGHREIFRIE